MKKIIIAASIAATFAVGAAMAADTSRTIALGLLGMALQADNRCGTRDTATWTDLVRENGGPLTSAEYARITFGGLRVVEQHGAGFCARYREIALDFYQLLTHTGKYAR